MDCNWKANDVGASGWREHKGSVSLRHSLCAAPAAVCPVVKQERGSIHRLTPALPPSPLPPPPPAPPSQPTDITTALCHAWCVSGSPRSGPGFSADNITGWWRRATGLWLHDDFSVGREATEPDQEVIRDWGSERGGGISRFVLSRGWTLQGVK